MPELFDISFKTINWWFWLSSMFCYMEIILTINYWQTGRISDRFFVLLIFSSKTFIWTSYYDTNFTKTKKDVKEKTLVEKKEDDL